MSARALQILGRFPGHLGATRAGTQLNTVVEALAAQLEVFSADVAGVRRSHRIGHAQTLRDVRLLGALHAIDNIDLSILSVREDRVRELLKALIADTEGSDDARNAAAEALFDLWGINMPQPRLPLFAPAHAPADDPDLVAAARNFAGKVQDGLKAIRHVDAVRARVLAIADIHQRGNGTVRALLEGAASALDMELDIEGNATLKRQLIDAGRADTLELLVDDELFHSKDLFWHSSIARERVPLIRSVPTLAPVKLVRMGKTIATSELADQMLLHFVDLHDALVTLDLLDVRPTTLLDQATAQSIATEFGFTVERFARSTIRIGANIPLADLAIRFGQRAQELIDHLDSLDETGLTPTSVITPESAARAARKYGFLIEQIIPVTQEYIGMEENPRRREEFRKEECEHGHVFSVLRRGFGMEPLQVHVIGRADKTVGPMIVNRDEGKGIGWFGTVPDTQTLVFEEEGRVLLDGDDVTENAYSWVGACFADFEQPSAHDFVIAGPGDNPFRRASFAVATPANSLNREFEFPHSGESIQMPGIGIGETRMAFFAQQAHLSSRDSDDEDTGIRRVTPHPFIGFADRSVFAPAGGAPDGVHAASDYDNPKVADIVLSWLEHEAYALRLIIPSRFQLFDGAGAPINERLVAALERFRPAGVQIRVDYYDGRWLTDEGVLADDGPMDPDLILLGGTVLWPAPADDT